MSLLLGLGLFVLGVNVGFVVLGLLVAHGQREKARIAETTETDPRETDDEPGVDGLSETDDEQVATDSLLRGGERVGTKRTTRGLSETDEADDADSPEGSA